MNKNGMVWVQFAPGKQPWCIKKFLLVYHHFINDYKEETTIFGIPRS